jgi:hypothetical protein
MSFDDLCRKDMKHLAIFRHSVRKIYKPPESGLRNTIVHSVCHPNAGRGGLDLSSLRLIGTGHHLASIHYYRWKRHMKGFSKNGTPYFAHQISNGHCL